MDNCKKSFPAFRGSGRPKFGLRRLLKGGQRRKSVVGTREAAQKAIDNCLHICLQLTANLAVFINPFLPFAARKMCHMMKVVDRMLDWENAGKGKLLSVGYSLREPQLLFRKIEDREVAEQIEKLKIKAAKIKMEETAGTKSPSDNSLAPNVSAEGTGTGK